MHMHFADTAHIILSKRPQRAAEIWPLGQSRPVRQGGMTEKKTSPAAIQQLISIKTKPSPVTYRNMPFKYLNKPVSKKESCSRPHMFCNTWNISLWTSQDQLSARSSLRWASPQMNPDWFWNRYIGTTCQQLLVSLRKDLLRGCDDGEGHKG